MKRLNDASLTIESIFTEAELKRLREGGQKHCTATHSCLGW
jgi:hypothetical protein